MLFSWRTIARFWSKVSIPSGDNECWEWTGGKTGSGYGTFKPQETGEPIGAHRMAYYLKNGEFPEDGLVVRHTCDNKTCVNPHHLIPGTKADNARDAVERGLFPKIDRAGDNNGAAKLSAAKVADIMFFLEKGVSINWLAKKYGVTYDAVWRVKTGKSWASVTKIDGQAPH